MAKDYYQVLEVNRDASEDEIQKAYRRLARKYHPDIADDKEQATKKFQEIQQAYDVLSDQKKRSLYDSYGPNFEQMAGAPFGQGPGGQQMDIDLNDLFGRGGPFGGNSGGGRGGFEDILRQFGGGFQPGQQGFGPEGFPQQQAQAAPMDLDIQQESTISFHAAVKGGQHAITLQRPGSKAEEFKFKIPAGIESGKKIRLRGQGRQDPQSGRKGDLLIRIKVAPHPCYQRSGNHLHLRLPIHVSEAIRGGKIDVPTPHGTIAVTIPAGSSSHKTLRLKSMGVKPEKGTPGDLLIELEITVPKLNDELLEKLIGPLAVEEAAVDIRRDIRW